MFLRFIDSALLREWTVQSLIVDWTHLVLVLGKLVLQKPWCWQLTNKGDKNIKSPVEPKSIHQTIPSLIFATSEEQKV